MRFILELGVGCWLLVVRVGIDSPARDYMIPTNRDSYIVHRNSLNSTESNRNSYIVNRNSLKIKKS